MQALEIEGMLKDAFATEGAAGLLRTAATCFGAQLVFASSFSVEDVVVTDLLARTGQPFRLVTLDTGRLPEETHSTLERVRQRYGVTVEVFFPNTQAVEALVRLKGTTSFYESVENRRECCGVRKVEPLGRALQGARAWVTGMRRAQSVTRTALDAVERDASHEGAWKLSPLADWSDEDVWAYARKEALPYNRLHDRGYPSIGCAPCTRAVAPGDDVRSGRWWWESADHKECGLHLREPTGTPSGAAT